MTSNEKLLIAAIQAIPGHQVFFGYADASIKVVTSTPTSVRQQSIWLGRTSTVDRLQAILNTVKGI